MSASNIQGDTAQQVKDAAQILDVIGECISLKKSGVNYKGLCPFHGEKTPSFMVNPERQTFHCFGCGEGGDVFTFMMMYHRMTFPEALKELAGRYHILLPEKKYSPADKEKAEKRQLLFAANDLAASVYHEFLLYSPESGKARGYLKERGIPLEIIKEFRLGYAPESWDFLGKKIDRSKVSSSAAEEAGLLVKKEKGGYYDRFRDRVLCPINDLTGRVVGFSGRILGDGQPKYMNSPETLVFEKNRTVYGLFQHKDNIRKEKRAVVVEGNFDLLSLAVQGIRTVVAPLGTAMTRNHVRSLRGYADEIILLFDGDSAGLKAALRAVPFFLEEQVNGRVAVLPEGHDPDTFVRKYGRDELEKNLDKALPLPEFVFDRLVEKHGMTLDGKSRILEDLRPLIETASKNPMQRSVFVSHFSDRLKLDPDQVMRGFSSSGRSQSNRPAKSSGISIKYESGHMPQKQKQLLEFLVVYPEYVQRFIENGVEDVIDHPSAREILSCLKQLSHEPQPAKPECLLDLMSDGPERAFVSRLLISSSFDGDEEDDQLVEKVAEEQLSWIKRFRVENFKRELNRKIEQAQQEGDNDLLLQLIAQKTELDASLILPGDDEDV